MAKIGRPKQFTEAEQREKRRIRSAKQRAENPDRVREITRESMRRMAAARAIAAGREPGTIGRPAEFTPEENKAKRLEKAKRYYWANREKMASEAAVREREKRHAIKAGTFVPAKLKRLTDDERKASGILHKNIRRALLRKAEGKHTRADIVALRVLQQGNCAWCLLPLGRNTHVDHYVPLSRGGSNDRGNLRLLHEKCNVLKANHDPLAYGLRSGLLCW